MSWWPAPSKSAAPGAAAPAAPSPCPSAGSNKADQRATAGCHTSRGGGTWRSSEQGAVSSLGRKRSALGISRGTGRSGGGSSSNGPEVQRGSPASAQKRASENDAAKNVNGRRGSSGSGRAAQKIQKPRHLGRGPLKTQTQSPSPSGIGSTRNNHKTLSITPPPSAKNVGTGMTIGGGWLDGLGSLVGLRPPTSIDLPSPTSASSGRDARNATTSAAASFPKSTPARFSGTGTSEKKNQEQDRPLFLPSVAEKMQKVSSPLESSPRPSSLISLPKRGTSSSVAAESSPPPSPRTPPRKASKTNGTTSAKAQTTELATIEPSQTPKNDHRRSSTSVRSNNVPPSTGTRRPIKLISATIRPTVASLSATATTKSKPPMDKKKNKRHRRQISDEIIAALERDIFSDDEDMEDDGISVKETLIEGLKSWKPAFCRSSPHPAPARTSPTSGRSGDRRLRRRGVPGAATRGHRRRPTGPPEARHGSRGSTRERSKSRPRRQHQERCSISTTQRTASSALTETSGSTNEGNSGGHCRRLSKREELERTMNTCAGCPSPSSSSCRPPEKDGRNQKWFQSEDVRELPPQPPCQPVLPSPKTPSSSKAKAAMPISTAPKSGKCDPPREKATKASPARSTESSRTAQTIETDEESPPSTPSRLSSSDSPEDLEAGRDSSSRNEVPKLIVDKTPALASPTKEEQQQRKERARQQFYANNFAVFAHGRITTIIPVICAGIALILSVVAKRSTNFVTLKEPLLVSPTFDKVERVGLVFLDLCLADEFTTVAEGSGIETKVGIDYRAAVGRSSPHPQGTEAVEEEGGFSVIGNLLSWANPPSIEVYDQIIEDYDHDDYIFVGPSDDEFETDMAGWDELITVVRSPKICRSIKITSSTLTDNLWHVSRTFLSLAIGFGFFLSFMLCSAAYWSTINLKPVALGLLMTYFFQSMTFFFFDSGICREHDCKMSSGAASAVVASIFWFAAALGTIWMDMVYIQKNRRRERRERRRRRRERRRKRRREARAAFEAIKKKAEAALDRMESQHSGESVSDCSVLSDDDVEEGSLLSLMRDLGLGSGESDGFDNEDDEWIENDVRASFLHEDYIWDKEESRVHDSDIYNAISFR
mmetsp:Transcript_15682/g.45286  ORF Transcript_15682/g.45286 Transcript_15682/m.45286 type:complete len:1110 (+) Transcript_15682:436-3765(+)